MPDGKGFESVEESGQLEPRWLFAQSKREEDEVGAKS